MRGMVKMVIKHKVQASALVRQYMSETVSGV